MIIRLGGFDIITSYLLALGTNGLKEVLDESSVLTGVQLSAALHFS